MVRPKYLFAATLRQNLLSKSYSIFILFLVDEAVVPEAIAVKPIKKRKRSDSEDEYKPEELTSTAGKPSSSKPTARGRKAAAKKPPKRKKLASDDASEALDEEMGEEAQQGQVRGKKTSLFLGYIFGLNKERKISIQVVQNLY